MRAILQTYTAAELRKFISLSTIKGVTKMKKPQLINEMVKAKHIGNFKHIKAKGTKATPAKPDIRKSKPTTAVLKIKEQIKKQADKIKADRTKSAPAPAPKKRVKKPLTVTTADGKKTVLKKKAKPAKLKIPSITISEVPKEKKPKRKEIKSSLGKIPAPKVRIRIAPKAKPAPKKKEEKKKAPVDKDLRKRLRALRKAAEEAQQGGGGGRDLRSAEAKEKERLEALKPKAAKAKDVDLSRAEYSKADMVFGFTRTKIKSKMKKLKTSKEMKAFLKDFKAAKTKGLLTQLVDAGYSKKSSLKFVKEEQIPTFKLSLEQILEDKIKEESKN